jgi:hypothetical protein
VEHLTTEQKLSLLDKLVGMFQPYDNDGRPFMGVHAQHDVITGPADRAVVGFDTHFPVTWLVEDYNFTDHEARWLVDAVHARDKESTNAD